MCKRHQWRFCFIGGLAVQRWGEPRLTQDVVLTILTGFGRETEFVTAILERLQPRLEDPVAFALENRVLLVKTAGGVDVDISLGAMPFEASVVRRATPYRFLPQVTLLTCSAEDLIVLKAFADRPKDWVDVEGVLTRQRGKLSWRYIWAQLRPLAELKGEPEILAGLKRLQKR
jgi:hypothetical protein